MGIKKYFENTRGVGVLSTADKKGVVASAIYARPHLMDDGKAAFIMADKLTHRNLQENPYACYLFKQDGSGYSGKRLYLKKRSETGDKEMINKLRRRCRSHCCEADDKNRYLVLFDIKKELPLVGSAKAVE